MTDGVDMGVLPGMGDIPEPAASAPAGGDARGRSPGRARRTAKKSTRSPAETLPVARVAVDMPLPHLDRPFDYLVPATLDDAAVPGCRVRVRFAGQLMDGFLLDRVAESDHEGRLAYLERVTSPEPVLTPEIAALAREVADRYAGTLADVLRLAIPPRHARVEGEDAAAAAPPESAGEAGAPDPTARPAVDAHTTNAAAPSTTGAGADSPAQPEVVSEDTAATEAGGLAAGPSGATAADTATFTGEDTAAVEAGRRVRGHSADAGAAEGDRTTVPGEDTAAVEAQGAGAEPSDVMVADTAAVTGEDTAVTEARRGVQGDSAGPSGVSEADRTTVPGEDTAAVEAQGAAAEPSDVMAADTAAVTGEDTAVTEARRGAQGHSAGPSGMTAAAVEAGAGARGPAAGPPGVTAADTTTVTGPATVSGVQKPDGAAEAGAVRDAAVEPGTARDAAVEPEAVRDAAVEAGPWADYPAGASFLDAVTAGRAPRAIWSALPGTDWTLAVARAVRATLAGGRGALVIVADGRDVARVDRALADELGPGRHVALTAELGPAERYRRWLAVRRGHVGAVVGTRAAMFAPVRDLGLVVLWDDGDDVHAEPHAPYPHAREVLALRAHRAAAGALIGGFTRTSDATQLMRAGWARPLVPGRERLRASMPYIRPSGDDTDLARDEAARSARLPHLAFRTARQGLEHGPVLVQVPRRGYVPALACSRCRGPARCPECEGPLSLRSSHAAPYCRWCGRIAGAWSCPECGGRQVRAVVVGARRTAEELGRAFPGVPVRTSGRDGVLAAVGGEPALVVSTPGAEPVAEDGGYAAALLLDGWVLLGRADLRAGEEALRRWMNAAALVRPHGPVVVLADGSLTPVQALIRWDAVTYAERELAERQDLGFPPAVRMASLTGTPQAVRELVDAAGLPGDAEVLGPVEVGEGQERALVRVDRARGVALARLLKTAQAARSTRKTADVVRVRVDPLELI